MGNTVEYKPRKATFTVTGKGADRVFTPVNRRAHIVAKKVGKRTKLSITDLKKSKNMGTYRIFAYTPKGALVSVRV